MTLFLNSPYVHGIYVRWASELNTLSLEIKYIEGSRNTTADALSRAVFDDLDAPDELLESMGTLTENEAGEPAWI